MHAQPQDQPAAAVNDAQDALTPARRVLVFCIVSLALLMMSVDSTIVATALHALQQDLHTSVNWAGWTITAYAFGFVLMLPISGRLSGRYGRRRVFLGSVVVFTGASLLCGLTDDIAALVALRALQAAGGAGFTPSATGIVVDHFGQARDRAVGLFGSIFPIGSMIGPIFGGLFVTYWNWRGVFFVNVPIGLAVIALALRYVPRDAVRQGVPQQRQQHMDGLGMGLLAATLLTGMLVASYLGEPESPLSPPMLAVLALVATGCGWLFLRHVGRCSYPFIDPLLIHGPGFGAVNLVNMIYGGACIGATALVPLYATTRYGMDALQAGTLLMSQGAASITLSLLATAALRRTGYRLPLYLGGAISALGMAMIALAPPAGMAPHSWLSGAALTVGIGAGMVNPASRNAGLQLAPEHASAIAGLRSLCFQIGTIAVVSLATAALAGAGGTDTRQAWVYAAIALLLALALPLVARVPEHRGTW
ncbi:MAG: MFS transporter [Proteobacteria bacterium]|nr:MFS transporter [Pseudomonadota bacterium]